MNIFSFRCFLLSLLCLCIFGGQEIQGKGISSSYRRLSQAIQKKQWEEGFKITEEVIEPYRKTGIYVFGPKFGEFWFYQGLCALKLKDYSKAKKAFHHCFTDFANKDSTPKTKRNSKDASARFYYADALKGEKKYPEAIKAYLNFLQITEQDSLSIQRWFASIHLAMTYLSLPAPEIEKAYDLLDLVAKSSINEPKVRVYLLEQLTKQAIMRKNPALFVDFCRLHSASLLRSNQENAQTASFYLRSITDAINADMPAIASEFFSFIPLQAWNQEALARSIDEALLEILAKIYIKEKLWQEALIAYEFLRGEGSDKQEEYTFRLLNLYASAGRKEKLRELLIHFHQQFPESKYLLESHRLLLFSDYQLGNYESSIQVAMEILEKVEKPSEIHELTLYILGANYIQLKQYEQARQWFKNLIKMYPQGKWIKNAKSLLADSWKQESSLEKRTKAMEKFLQENPESSKVPELLYLLGVDYQKTDKMRSLEYFKRLKEDYSNSAYFAWSLLIQASWLIEEKQNQKARELCLQALKLAKKIKDISLQVETLNYLILFPNNQKEETHKEKEIADFFQQILEFPLAESIKSPLSAKASIKAADILAKRGKSEEVLSFLRFALLKSPLPEKELADLSRIYSLIYLKNHSIEQLKENAFIDFQGSKQAKISKSYFILVAIEELERMIKREISGAKKENLSLQKAVLYTSLQKDFSREILPSEILLKVCDYLRAERREREEDLALVIEVQNRKDRFFYPALLRKSLLEITLGKTEKIATQLEKVIASKIKKTEKELAFYTLTKFYFSQNEWQKCLDISTRYLDKKKHQFFTYAPEISLFYARSYDSLNFQEDAIAAYTRIFGSYIGYIRVSAPAVSRWMELIWERNLPSPNETQDNDRMAAWRLGTRYIKTTQNLLEKMTREERESWEKVQKQVENYQTILNINEDNDEES